MATAVLDIDIERIPAEISGLGRYSRALVLLRIDGRPVGQALLPVKEGRVGGQRLRHQLMCAADSAFWDQWLRNYLGLERARGESVASPAATVAICTRDRTEGLRRCLEALMQMPDDGQDYLVVDDFPSTDSTRRLVDGYARVRYIREDRPGLDIARNRALQDSKREIVAFIDDDATPDPKWLRNLLRNFDDPLVACVTGLTLPVELETEAQEWFQRLGGLGRGFKRIIFDPAQHNPLEGWQAGAGVNMALRTSVLQSIGYFDEALDVGTPVRGGGDSEIFSRILGSGHRIVYDPEALSWHVHRRAWSDLRKQLFGYEAAGFAFWTERLVFERELGVLNEVWDWFRRELMTLGSSVRRSPGSAPLDLVLARFCGALVGPGAYFHSRRMARKKTPA